MKRIPAILLLSFIIAGTLSAQIRLPAIIGDNMVLQQRSTVTLWGWAASGEQLTITASWLKKPLQTTANSNGDWQVTLKTIKAGGPYTIRFQASNTIEINNVLLGEVWLASGQSNMEFPIGKGKVEAWRTGTIGYEQVISEASHPLIRMIEVPRTTAETEQSDFKGTWEICLPQTAGRFSAVAYFFAREINQATGYPVGIINSTWGGTPAESWTKKQVLENDPELRPILGRYDQRLKEYHEARSTYEVAYEKWEHDTNPSKGPAPKEPSGPNAQSPFLLYNGMIAPLIPFKLRGVIWYQGESNAVRGYQYRTLFPAMINSWRKDWNDDRLPFYFVQISPHRGQNPDIREAQFYTFRTTPYTGMAVTTDNGDSLDIHPRNKELVGKRLSLWALHNEYGRKKLVVSGPLYHSMKTDGDKIRIRFDYSKGLKSQGESLNEFTIAAADQVFVPAQARIEGNTVVVWSDAVKQPVAVRFAWRNIPRADLYNEAGLPASPFRTDNWTIPTQGKR